MTAASDFFVILGMLALVVLLFPKYGIYFRWRRMLLDSARIVQEDVLKHVFNSGRAGEPATIEHVAAALSLSGEKMSSVIDVLTAKKLILRRGAELQLTQEGTEYALQVIRLHRLWERHLADETTVEELDWHSDAEKQEHRISSEEAEELSRRLGYPVYDPHGDPIPGPDGSLPEPRGKPLLSFHRGTFIRITHVEDEPAHIYARLVEHGIYAGLAVKIIDSSEGGMILLEKEGKRIELSPSEAGNIAGATISPSEFNLTRRTLATLAIGERGRVESISLACRGLQRRRLMDLGIVPGTVIEAEMESAGGNPIAYRIRGAAIALRRQQAEMVYIGETEKNQ